MQTLYLAFAILLAAQHSLAFPFSAVAAIVCSDQLNATQIADACQTGTSPACIWTFDYQGTQTTVCTQNGTLVNQQLQNNNVSACVCGSTASYSSADSQVTIGDASVSYSSEACTGGFCPLWYSSQPSYTCSGGIPALGDLSATSVGVIQGGVSSSQSGSALIGSATQSATATSSGTGTVTGTATTTAKSKTTTSSNSGSSGGSSSSPAYQLRISFSLLVTVLIVVMSNLYAL